MSSGANSLCVSAVQYLPPEPKWHAPEMLHRVPRHLVTSSEAEVYAFACVYVYTGGCFARPTLDGLLHLRLVYFMAFCTSTRSHWRACWMFRRLAHSATCIKLAVSCFGTRWHIVSSLRRQHGRNDGSSRQRAICQCVVCTSGADRCSFSIGYSGVSLTKHCCILITQSTTPRGPPSDTGIPNKMNTSRSFTAVAVDRCSQTLNLP